MRLGSPPKGHANWSLRLLARKVVELVELVSHETLRKVAQITQIAEHGPIGEMSDDAFDRQVDVNIRGGECSSSRSS